LQISYINAKSTPPSDKKQLYEYRVGDVLRNVCRHGKLDLQYAQLCPENYTVFYMVFYDTLSDIVSKFGGRVIKHVGDALIIYFPATYDPTNREAFQLTLDCAMTMLDSRCVINTTFYEKGLPPLSYRISADYGQMKSIETETSSALDWIGPSMNMVAKMNHLAHSNSLVVGGDLHQMLSRFSFRDYLLEHTGELNIGIKQKYPVYSITKRKRNGAISNSNTVVVTDPIQPFIRLEME
jgi:adenylate cyclase